MKWILALLLVGVVFAQEEVNESLPLAEVCDVDACELPNCRCSTVEAPIGLTPRNIPQFVTLTFDDNVNVNNILTYRELIYGRRNTNNCPSRVTFYVNHEYTNYVLVNELYNNGMEIALHSITHQTNQTYWATASKEEMMREFGDQRAQMAHFASIPADQLRGVRMPFLQMTGNATFEVMKEVGLTYDSSWPTISFIDPGLWPYTLDYASSQDCVVPPCPTASIPGIWVTPIISWIDLEGTPCSFADACFHRPDLNDEEAWFQFILTNFERHYLGSRAPFGFYVHEWFVTGAVRSALNRFLNLVNNLNDAFMVSEGDVIDWMRDPVTVDEYKTRPCRTNPPSICVVRNCGPLDASHTEEQFWMQICQNCPRVYPWLGNHLGL